jgi:hypothetical protein
MKLIHVQLDLTDDGPDRMDFEDTYEGLEDIWYRFSVNEQRGVSLLANADGYEHLARFFLKLARGAKSPGYHSHHALEFGQDPTDDLKHGRELTIGIVDKGVR